MCPKKQVSSKTIKKRGKDCGKKYCGDSETLPEGYYRFGSRSECLRTGYGIGYHKKNELPKSSSPRRVSKKLLEETRKELDEFIDKHLRKTLRGTSTSDIKLILKFLSDL